MATNFPTSLDSFTNPVAGDSLASPSHAEQHTNVNDAVEAIETALLDGAPLHIDDANNRVGIGTTSPASQFHVDGGASGAQARITASGADTSIAFLTEDQQNWSIGIDESDAGKLKIGESVNVGTVTRVTIDSSGNVGINDASPSYTLDVNGDINATGDLRIGGTAIGTWTDFTPVFATGFTIGNATVIAKYATINDVVVVYVNILFGSTTSVSGEVLFTLPVTAGDSFSATASLMGVAYDQNATETYPLAPRPYATTGVRIRAIDTSGATAKSLILSSTAPFTWTTNDRLVFTTYYEKG